MEYLLGARISSDHFYADLKGDLSPDVVVSRFPASEPEEMKNMCDYFIRYAQTRKEWGKSVLLTSYNREMCIRDRFDDPALGIDWKIPEAEMILSAKDRMHKRLSEAFVFEG